MTPVNKPGSEHYEKWRANVGKKKAIKTPEELYEYYCDYKAEVEATPFIREDFIRGGDMAGVKVKFKTMKPITWEGFEGYLFRLGIIQNLEDYRYNLDNRYTDYKGIIRAIDNDIFTHNYDGAAVGALKENLIAKKLGIIDKKQIEIKAEQPLFGDDAE